MISYDYAFKHCKDFLIIIELKRETFVYLPGACHVKTDGMVINAISNVQVAVVSTVTE